MYISVGVNIRDVEYIVVFIMGKDEFQLTMNMSESKTAGSPKTLDLPLNKRASDDGMTLFEMEVNELSNENCPLPPSPHDLNR